MEREDAKRIVRIISAAYPSYHKSEQTLTDAVELWAMIFAEDHVIAVEAALKVYLSQPHEFAPTPGQIKEIMFNMANPDMLTEQEAWSLVLKALRNSLYGSEQEFNKLPQDIQRAIGSPAYLQETALHGNISVEESHFARRYRTVIERKRDENVIPHRPAIETTKTDYTKAVEDARARFEQMDIYDVKEIKN